MPRSDTATLRRVSEERLATLADRLDMDLDPQERHDYTELVNGLLGVFDTVLEAGDPAYPGGERHPDRPSGQRPDPAEDPLNAWVYRCEVGGATDGSLTGLEVGVKDSIAVAGYPMQAGSDVLEGFVPTVDAIVIDRVLSAGARITGKQNMESFAFSGSGDTSDFGPVINPHDDAYLAGGSSSGSAAAVATGDCDVSLGTDQAGSVRIPSACCGTVGLKPTTGLVPYTGVLALDTGIDHVGPIANSVIDVAEVLEVIAGTASVDGVPIDPRQPQSLEPDAYTTAIADGIEDVTVGVLEDGFDWEFSDPDIDRTVRDAVEVFEDVGAETTRMSMPRHRLLSSAAGVIATIGGARTFGNNGVASSASGWYWSEFAGAMDAFLDSRTDQLPPSVKQAMLAAEHVLENRGMAPYAIAQNIALDARRRYDELLNDCDVFALPTLAVPPMRHDPEMNRVEATAREWTLAQNTAATDLTGHPAISIPCGMVDGLPVGMMLVGKHFDEATVLRVAAGFERETDWKSRKR